MNDQRKPTWAGDDLLSRFVNRLIETKPLYGIMRTQARRVLIKTAEEHGIPWRETCQMLEKSGIQETIATLSDPTITYPEYYQVPFHAYPEGNLSWQAAFEAESATCAMALRIWPDEDLTWQTAQERLRSSFHDVLAKYGPTSVQDILDVGCSVGISTQYLHRFYVQASTAAASPPIRTIGLDLSPYMLAVAQYRDPDREIHAWHHRRAEATGYPDASFDLVTLQFLLHELPQQATITIFEEVLRILRPGGYLAIVDNNPQSPVIQNLPPVLFTLMKSTEPWSDEYYTLDVEATLAAVGFDYKITVASDPRHRTILACKQNP